MTDKQYTIATKIREDISQLEFLKKEIPKSIRISIDLTKLELLREPLAKTIDEEIGKLKAEYEKL